MHQVRAQVQLWAPAATTGHVTVSVGGVPGATVSSATQSLKAGANTIKVTIPAAATKGVKLWHPHGNGAQPRYNLSATFNPAAASNSDSGGGGAALTWRLLGFRHVALVTMNDTDAAAAAKAATTDGTGQLGEKHKRG